MFFREMISKHYNSQGKLLNTMKSDTAENVTIRLLMTRFLVASFLQPNICLSEYCTCKLTSLHMRISNFAPAGDLDGMRCKKTFGFIICLIHKSHLYIKTNRTSFFFFLLSWFKLCHYF